MNNSHRHHDEQKKPETKDCVYCMSYDFIYWLSKARPTDDNRCQNDGNF
jgi:hypothetical protein